MSLPLDAINAASAREKSIRHGHPSTLHLWWARRPLAACRAVLFAQLVDDPSSCADEFPTIEAQEKERQRLHGIIEAMVPWEASTNETILHAARYEIARSVARNGGPPLTPEWRKPTHARDVIDYLQTHAPPVHDPFSGGGSIPLEAQRLGLRARGSDLNPVAVLIGKALVEFPPKFAGMAPVNPEADGHVAWKGAKGLANDVRYYGRWMREQTAKRIGHLYPKAKLPGGGEAMVIAWLWARTVPSPDPRAKGAHVPLVTTFVLSAKKGREVIVRPVVDRHEMTWTFEVDDQPTAEALVAAKNGTKAARGYFTCILTGAPITYAEIDHEANLNGLRQRLIAVVVDGDRGRAYLPPSLEHEELALGLERPTIVEVEQPCRGTFASNAQGRIYGYKTFADYFTARQITALDVFSDLVSEVREDVLTRYEHSNCSSGVSNTEPLATGGLGAQAYADAVATYLSFAVSKASSRSCTMAIWEPGMGRLAGAFGRQAVPMQWSFAETNPIAGAGGDIAGTAVSVAEVLEALVPIGSGFVENRDAALNDFTSDTTFSTDPPYYDNVGYADLSDFFYVWLRRTAGLIHPELFRRLQTPKERELIASTYRHGGKEGAERFFMEGMSAALAGLSKAHGSNPVAIYYAFKQSEAGADGVTSAGWATFLQAVVDSGFLIDGTWPIRTEATNALKASIAALASSIVLVCRRRATDADTITRPEFLRRLRAEMPAALATIRAAGVGPTDIQQAAIGPGIGIFTRYAAVLDTDGEPMSVRDALKIVNQVREEIASEGEGDYDADTRFAIDWFVAHGFAPGKSGDAISMANAANLGLSDLIAAGVLEAKGGEARLLRRTDMPADWDPRKDKRPTAWEACQHLIRRLEAEDGGVDAAAQLFAILGDLTDPAHQLAFRLYDICETKGWHAEGRPYNLLIQEWAEIENLAFALRPAPPAQGEMAI